MESIILDNGIKLIYENRPGFITSFCIGLNAGALEENDFPYGTAHMIEHMLFKGTSNRKEKEINELLDRYFGVSNAMTNYPYAIYYGTLNSEDFNMGFEVYSDILINAVFPIEGFQEEKKIILEELLDWRSDPSQRCEDLLFANSFKGRRINELIIGNEESVKELDINTLKDFYRKYYCPENCVISVVSSLEFSEVIEIVTSQMGSWKNNYNGIDEDLYEDNISGIFTNKENIEGAKIQYCFPIHNLSDQDILSLDLFNLYFGEGMGSLLFDEIRTKSGLAYEIYSEVKAERGIKLFKINMSTSKKNIEKSIELIDKCIEVAKHSNWLTNEKYQQLAKRYILKKQLAVEKSIELSKRIVTHELMFGHYIDISENMLCEKINLNHIQDMIKQLLNKPSTQILV